MKKRPFIRSADISDVDSIFSLLEMYTASGIVLSRSKEDIALFIGNFVVAEFDGLVCGCAAVRFFGNDLQEIRSLVIHPAYQNKGVGRSIIEYIIARVRKTQNSDWRIFALTMTPEFFCKSGFKVVEKNLFPEKIWSDCSKCAKRDRCDETAVLLTPQD